MKTLFRILVILVAACVVIGVTYAIGQTEWAAERAQSGFSHKPAEGSLSPEGVEHAEGRGVPREELGRHGGGREASPFSSSSLLSFAHTLIPMALVIVVVALVTKGIDAIRRRAIPTRG